VKDANPLPNSPITIADWFGGPSIYFFTADHLLSGIDHIPQNDTWKLSSIASYQIRVHERSRIASMAWLNSSASWIYYQEPNEQIREFGIDDYRDISWREGSAGALYKAKVGSAIGVST